MRTRSPSYSLSRDAQIETDIFRPRGISKAGFYAGNFPGLSQQAQLFSSIDNTVQNYNYGVDLLVAGLDERGAHVFHIANPGGAFTDFYQIGYHGVGSGHIHAVQHLIASNQSRLKSLEETLMAVFVAKRRAESAPGVGTETDIWIIQDENVIHLDHRQLETMDDLAKEYFGDYQTEVFQKVRVIYERSDNQPDANQN
jgi:20S proteasome alpha/beta subunit